MMDVNNHRFRKRVKQTSVNILVKGINDYLNDKRSSLDGLDGKLDAAVTQAQLDGLKLAELPKRYTIYEPMLLLGSNFPSQTPAWAAFYSSLAATDKHALFSTIAKSFRNAGHKITHLALNAPIKLSLNDDDADGNVMRSPLNLQPLYGDFGPAELLDADSTQPTQADFDAALWVMTSQLSGIEQVWAPRWTMFSRGNISEKARILGLTQQNSSPFPGLSVEELEQDVGIVDVVDLYVGIGYFAFPYLKRGVKRVFGWEINGWSVEGLRRGCERNGIRCEVVRVPDNANAQQQNEVVKHVVDVLCEKTDVRCIVFWGDNSFAAEIIGEVTRVMKGVTSSLSVRQCNLGLLPTSQGSWKAAVQVIDPVLGGWLHVHENAEIEAVQQKKQYVVGALAPAVRQDKGASWQVSCEHVEMVKTYAPGVGHFVFDIKLWPAN